MQNTRNKFHFPGRYTLYSMNNCFVIVDRKNGGCMVPDSPSCIDTIKVGTEMLNRYKKEHGDV